MMNMYKWLLTLLMLTSMLRSTLSRDHPIAELPAQHLWLENSLWHMRQRELEHQRGGMGASSYGQMARTQLLRLHPLAFFTIRWVD